MKKLFAILFVIFLSSCLNNEEKRKLDFTIFDAHDLQEHKPLIVHSKSKHWVSRHYDSFDEFEVILKDYKGEWYEVNDNSLSGLIFDNYKIGDTIK
jgi:hypothetical protein